MEHFAFENRVAAARRRFIRTQSIKGGLGLGLSFAYATLIRWPGVLETIAALGLVAPTAFAALALTRIKLAKLEAASVLVSAAVVAVLSIISGGLASPFLLWLVLVPFEAAVAGRRAMVALGGLGAVIALGLVAALQASGHLPPARFPEPHALWLGLSAVVAILHANLMAMSAQERHSEADAAAEAGEERYRFLAENALDMITRHSADGTIRFASPASLTLLGYRPVELADVHLSVITHAEDRDAVAACFRAASAGEPATAELRLKTKSGGHLWTELRCRKVQGCPWTGRFASDWDIVAVTRDITERKAHERELIAARDVAQDSSRAKSRFLANMSHELRTPLNAIIGFSELMKREMFGPLTDRYRDYAGAVHDSGTHLLRLINSVLDMSKIEAGRYKIAREKFALEETLTQAMRLVTIQAEAAGVALKHAIADEAREISADKRALAQILINLLSNAVKFTPSGGTVSVVARRAHLGVEIAVSDTGVGIPAADLKRLGQPFEQVDNKETRAKEGTGLGLALVRALTELHGGRMDIESVVGKGTTVRITLPQPKAQGAAANAA